METYKHIKDYVFQNCIKDQRGNPMYTHDVVLVSTNISLMLQRATLMSIGFDGSRQIHHADANVIAKLKEWGVEEE